MRNKLEPLYNRNDSNTISVTHDARKHIDQDIKEESHDLLKKSIMKINKKIETAEDILSDVRKSVDLINQDLSALKMGTFQSNNE